MISSVSDHVSTVSTASRSLFQIISVLRNLSFFSIRIYMRIAALKMHNRSPLWMFNPRMNINHRSASFVGNRWKTFWTDVVARGNRDQIHGDTITNCLLCHVKSNDTTRVARYELRYRKWNMSISNLNRSWSNSVHADCAIVHALLNQLDKLHLRLGLVCTI